MRKADEVDPAPATNQNQRRFATEAALPVGELARCLLRVIRGGFAFPGNDLRLTSPPFMADALIRDGGRSANQLRPLRFQHHIAPHAAGSTLVEWGNTRVICGVTIEETVPRWMKEQGVTGGWITAEYSMLPYS